MRRYNILLSNDDGVYAEGIDVLYRTFRAAGHKVTVVAPDRNQSAASHSLTLEYPLRIQKINREDFTAVRGTPTDSVFLAVNTLLESRPDIVVSGINNGANLCDDVIYSGTVAAAAEGRHFGLPAMAVSLCGSVHYETAARVTAGILEKIDECPIPPDNILNINVPDLPWDAVRGVRVTRLGRRMSSDNVVTDRDMRGETIYWIGPQAGASDSGADTDIRAVSEGYVSVTPLHIDLTAYRALDDLARWMDRICEDENF